MYIMYVYMYRYIYFIESYNNTGRRRYKTTLLGT